MGEEGEGREEKGGQREGGEGRKGKEEGGEGDTGGQGRDWAPPQCLTQIDAPVM
jgi:hypothetical protein